MTYDISRKTTTRPELRPEVSHHDPSSLETGEIARPLGPNERFMLMADRVSPNNMCAVFMMRGPFSESQFTAALSNLQDRHPLLRTNVSGRPERAAFRYRKSDGHSQIVPRLLNWPMEDWLGVAEKELSTRMRLDVDPPLRVTVMGNNLAEKGEQRFTLLITMNHVFTDGRSFAVMVRDLFKSLGEIHRGGSGRMNRLPAALPIEAIVPPSMKGFRGFAHLLREQRITSRVLRTMGGSVHTVRVGHCPNPDEWKTGIELLYLTQEETTALLQRSREQRTTMQGALAALLCKALLPELESGTGPEKTIRLMNTVDVRSKVPSPNNEDVGVYACSAPTLHKLAETTEVWDLAREIREQLQGSLERGVPFFSLAPLGLTTSLGFMYPRVGGAKAQYEKVSQLMKLTNSYATAGIMNLGVIYLDDVLGPYKIEQLHGCLGTPPIMPVAGIAFTYNSRLSFSLSYLQPLVEPQRARAVVERMRKELRALLGGEKAMPDQSFNARLTNVRRADECQMSNKT